MFRVAGRSFAMAHATDEVKAAATEHLRADVTTGGGVAEAAERAGLLSRSSAHPRPDFARRSSTLPVATTARDAATLCCVSMIHLPGQCLDLARSGLRSGGLIVPARGRGRSWRWSAISRRVVCPVIMVPIVLVVDVRSSARSARRLVRLADPAPACDAARPRRSLLLGRRSRPVRGPLSSVRTLARSRPWPSVSAQVGLYT